TADLDWNTFHRPLACQVTYHLGSRIIRRSAATASDTSGKGWWDTAVVGWAFRKRRSSRLAIVGLLRLAWPGLYLTGQQRRWSEHNLAGLGIRGFYDSLARIARGAESINHVGLDSHAVNIAISRVLQLYVVSVYADRRDPNDHSHKTAAGAAAGTVAGIEDVPLPGLGGGRRRRRDHGGNHQR